jgi:hypothetical protein
MPPARILDLFDPDNLPNRELERTIQPDDPSTVYRDLQDYVLPPEVKEWLFDRADSVVSQYLGSHRGVPDATCTWITGFFGSGKSHLLKVLAYLLSNKDVTDDAGRTLGATRFICDRLGVGNLAVLITNQLTARPVIVQMLAYARGTSRIGQESSIGYIILSWLERSLGRSQVPWIAHFEQLLDKNSKYEDFCAFVAETTASDGETRQWTEIRNDASLAYALLVQGLFKFLPRTHKTLELAAETVRLAEQKKYEPEEVVRRLVSEAKAIHPQKGRVLVCLDEVRLYLGDNLDRITELQVLAEKVKSVGLGKVFLLVTGQEAPEDVDSRFHQPGAGIGILADRFPEKFRLSANNIDYVVTERLLRKSGALERIAPLRKLIADHRPELSTAACIRTALVNPNNRFTNTEPAAIERCYPLLPYHVILLQEILSRLRNTGPSGGVVGTKERAILIIIRALFGEPESLLLGAEPVGRLATFDRVYDVLEEELKSIHLTQRDQIARILSDSGPDASWFASVAKAVLLLQQVAKQYFRVSDEVVAAVLYRQLGADPNAHLNRVKEALKTLSEAGNRYLTQDTELGYRFLTETETRFEKIVAEQDVSDAERFEVLKGAATVALKKKFAKIDFKGRHGTRKFAVKITLADSLSETPATLFSGAHLELNLVTPEAIEGHAHWFAECLVNSTEAPERIAWAIKDLGNLVETAERIVRVRKALLDPRVRTSDEREQEQIETQRARAEHLATDEEPNCLPSILLQGMGQGTLIWNGEKPDMHGIPTAEQRFADFAQQAIKTVYTEFDAGSAVVVDDDLREVLTWKTTRPACVQKLELMDAAGKVLLDRPVVKTVADRLRRPDHASDEARTGEALAAEFDAMPFGWDEHVVRAALAALLRSGAVVVKLGTSQIRTALETKAIDVFSGWNQFKKAVFEYVGELTPEQRMAASQALHSLFDRAGEDTFEKIDRALAEVVSGFLPKVIELVGVAEVGHLPCLAILTEFRDDLKAIQEATPGSGRIRSFLQPERQTRLANDVRAFTAIRDFKEKGSLDLYQKIQMFVTYPATPFVQRVGGDLRAQLAALRANLNHSEFYAGTRWSSITQAHHAIRQRYVSDYRDDHANRQTHIASAKASLTAHRNWVKLDEVEQRSILDAFESKECGSDPGTLDEAAAFVCTGCHADASTLALQAAAIAPLRAQAIARLDALDVPTAPGPPERPGPGTSGPVFIVRDQPVGTSGEVDALADQMRAELQRVLSDGPVTVDIQIHRQSTSRVGASHC